MVATGPLDLANQGMIKELKEKSEALALRKREELQASLDQGLIADPVSIAIAVGISVALSAASYVISYALSPKPKRQQQGKLTGSLQLQNSEQGIFIPEIYGAGPAVSLSTGSDPTYQNLANVTGGGSGSITKTSGGSTTWNAGASHNTAITSGQDAFFQFTLGTGYATAGFTLTASPTSGNTDFLFAVQWNPDSSVSVKYSGTQVLANVTHWATGDVFRVELRSGRFRLYKGSAELFLDGMVVPSPSYPLYMGIAMQTLSAGISAGKVLIGSIGSAPNAGRGGIKVPAIIVWSSGIRKVVTTTTVPSQGGKGFGGGGHSQSVDNITYNIDLGLMFGRGPLDLIREYGNADILIDQFNQSPNPSGVYDAGAGADADYDPSAPPDPSLNYLKPIERVDGDIPLDGAGVGTGTIQGGSSGFAIYPGNTTQQPDPTIESETDARYGTGSTPAYRNHAMIVHNTLEMSRWGGTVPNITAVWEHQSLRTLDLIFASMCERVGVLAANSDYDFTGIDIECRGLLVSGRPYQPAEVIGSPDLQLAYNYFVTEAEGQLVGYVEGDEPSVTIPDTEIGWLEGDGELPDILPEVDSIIAPEISLPREVHVKSLDPDFDWEPNTQSAMRQITEGQSVVILEIQIAQLSDERRTTAQRKLYRDYVAGTAHKFTLPWTYLYLHPGYKVTITRAEGFSHVMRLASITGGIGVLECEGVDIEVSAFTQPANGVFPPGYIPPQAVPAMVVMSMLDIPQFRPDDEGRSGFYAGGTPRTGVNQSFHGWTLKSQRNGVWTDRGSSGTAAIIGTVVSYTVYPVDSGEFDNVGTITVDLYGTTATLSSVSEAAVNDGENLAIVDESIFGFATATQVAGYPNRWELSDLLCGLNETEELWNAPSFVGKRFVVLDEAVVFIPAAEDELNNSIQYRGVAVGQSLGDAASFNFAWSGGNLRPRKVQSIILIRDGSNHWLIQFEGRPRAIEIPAQYAVEIWSDHTRDDPNKLKRTIPVTEGTTHACLIDSTGDTVSDPNDFGQVIETVHADKNNVSSGVGTATWQTIEDLRATFTRYDFTFRVDSDALTSTGTLIYAGLDHDDAFDTLERTLVKADSPVYVEWSSPDGANIEEKVYNYGTQFGSTRTFAWDSDGETQRYTILLAGSEYRVYANYQPGAGQVPLAVIPGPVNKTRGTISIAPSGFPFPLRLKGFIVDTSVGPFYTDNIVAGGSLLPTTIYSSDQQLEDFGVIQDVLFLRIYQKSRYDGVGNPVDV